IPAIRRLVTTAVRPVGKVHALWTLDGLDGLDSLTVSAALDDDSPLVRKAGIRVSERFLKERDGADLVPRIVTLARQPPAVVQLQAALTLGQLGDKDIDVFLAETARTYWQNTHLRDALLSGIGGRELSLLERLASDSRWGTVDVQANAILSSLAQGVFASRNPTAMEGVLNLAAAESGRAPLRVHGLLEGALVAFGTSKRPVHLDRAPQ